MPNEVRREILPPRIFQSCQALDMEAMASLGLLQRAGFALCLASIDRLQHVCGSLFYQVMLPMKQ